MSRNDYAKLCRRVSLRPIRTSVQYERAGELLGELIGRADAGLSAGESRYTDALSRLVRDYDEKHSSILKEIAARKSSPL